MPPRCEMGHIGMARNLVRIILSWLPLMVFFSGWGTRDITIQERTLKQNNPIAWEFDMPLAVVKTAISNAFDVEWRARQGYNRGATLQWKESGSYALCQ